MGANESGGAAIEHLGVLTIVVLLLLGLMQLPIGEHISTGFSQTVCRIIHGNSERSWECQAVVPGHGVADATVTFSILSADELGIERSRETHHLWGGLSVYSMDLDLETSIDIVELPDGSFQVSGFEGGALGATVGIGINAHAGCNKYGIELGESASGGAVVGGEAGIRVHVDSREQANEVAFEMAQKVGTNAALVALTKHSIVQSGNAISDLYKSAPRVFKPIADVLGTGSRAVSTRLDTSGSDVSIFVGFGISADASVAGTMPVPFMEKLIQASAHLDGSGGVWIHPDNSVNIVLSTAGRSAFEATNLLPASIRDALQRQLQSDTEIVPERDSQAGVEFELDVFVEPDGNIASVEMTTKTQVGSSRDVTKARLQTSSAQLQSFLTNIVDHVASEQTWPTLDDVVDPAHPLRFDVAKTQPFVVSDPLDCSAGLSISELVNFSAEAGASSSTTKRDD